jgi:LmbE family N-acetylglucosaminyl deacetylase
MAGPSSADMGEALERLAIGAADARGRTQKRSRFDSSSTFAVSRVAVPNWGWRNERCDGLPLSPGQRLVVVSPYFDDAILSLGATLASTSRNGIEVVNLTVFAGDPSSTELPSHWDRKSGFSSAGAAARQRRAEDKAACEIIGVDPVWLPFRGDQHGGDGTDIWSALEPVVAWANLILVPGFPLDRPDHLWVTRLIYQHEAELCPVGQYVEQPYADLVWSGYRRVPERTPSPAFMRRSISWARSLPPASAWLLKHRAVRRYVSHVHAPAFPRARLLMRTALYEISRGGEYVAFNRTPHSEVSGVVRDAALPEPLDVR